MLQELYQRVALPMFKTVSFETMLSLGGGHRGAMSRAFSAARSFGAFDPRALPWADMTQAVGLGMRQALGLETTIALDMLNERSDRGG